MKKILLMLFLLFIPAFLMAEVSPELQAIYSRELASAFSTLFVVGGLLLAVVAAGALMVAVVVGVMSLFEKLLVLVVGKEGSTYFAMSNIILTLLALVFGHSVSKRHGRKRG